MYKYLQHVSAVAGCDDSDDFFCVAGAVSLAAVVEYISAEVLELSGNCTRDRGEDRMSVSSVQRAIDGDEELVRSVLLPTPLYGCCGVRLCAYQHLELCRVHLTRCRCANADSSEGPLADAVGCLCRSRQDGRGVCDDRADALGCRCRGRVNWHGRSACVVHVHGQR
jgi:hypothetical protein